jgi:hypothetical protein
MAQEVKNVSKVPEITPELLEKNEEQQKIWREMFVVPQMSGAQYAGTVIRDNLNVLDAIDRHISEAKGELKKQLKQRSSILRHDTAIWAASIGQFELAVKLTTDKHQRKQYKQWLAADIRDDSEWCKHPIFEYVDGKMSQVAGRELEFFSVRSGKLVSMIVCNKCGFRNAKDMPAELHKLSRYRADAMKTGEDKHTSIEEVLRA